MKRFPLSHGPYIIKGTDNEKTMPVIIVKVMMGFRSPQKGPATDGDIIKKQRV